MFVGSTGSSFCKAVGCPLVDFAFVRPYHALLTLTRYRDGSATPTELLATASPHGWWLEWAGP